MVGAQSMFSGQKLEAPTRRFYHRRKLGRHVLDAPVRARQLALLDSRKFRFHLSVLQSRTEMGNRVVHPLHTARTRGVVQYHSSAVKAPPVIRIAITGVESTGKSTLTEALSAQLDGVAVHECARYDAEVIGGKVTLATLERLAREQAQACEDAVIQAMANGSACVISDTDALVLKLWGEQAYDQRPVGLERLERWSDLTLLCAPTIPWEADSLRSMPGLEDRLALHASFLDAVNTLPAHAVIDATTHEKRLDQAVRAFQNFAVNRR